MFYKAENVYVAKVRITEFMAFAITCTWTVVELSCYHILHIKKKWLLQSLTLLNISLVLVVSVRER